MSENGNSIEYINAGPAHEPRRIAVITTGMEGAEGDLCIVWLGGYRSDMTGTKAVALEAHAAAIGVPFIRFDYSGHGSSSGHYTEGTISTWLEDSRAVLDTFAQGKRLILVGSSMGGWVALRLIEELRKQKSATQAEGLVLIAPAPDFTVELIEPNLTADERASLEEKGYFEEPSEYAAEPNRFTRKLIDDGRNNRVLTGLIETGCPVHILQGMKDPDVPYSHALKIMEQLAADDAILTLIRDGDHRLSRPEDIERICDAVTAMTQNR
ncbi:alpha/beta hydrolase [Rhizobium sp. KVB221]|uniref:Palmitoyl-protein thioesterase ABHD10, mitochondrial n=1 Tax=Rhizobium setariae TaxID=2801340 RepID=A0A937CQ58_9HYPH|nr:alpha/beta hydrolase [Rhizobium setariae]MBL0372577.1 alpha/beta hydrolase [Rhizobium setariae]